MPSDFSNQVLRRRYAAHSGSDLLSQVHRVICLVTPNGFVTAGFHPSGEVLVVNSNHLESKYWNAEFIEEELLNDPLLAAPELIKSVFVAATKNMIIPERLYEDENQAHELLRSIFFCEANDEISVQVLDKCEASICYAFPKSVVEIFGKYTADLKVLPLSLVHFKNSISADNLLQCTISDDFSVATLHHKGQLLWHQTFEYDNAEDIAHKIAAASEHFGINIHSLPKSYTTTSIEYQTFLKKLSQYLPSEETIKASISSVIAPEWSATIHLFQQLNTCG